MSVTIAENMKKIIPFLLFIFSIQAAFSQKTIPVDSAGAKLKRFYLNENVENLWLANRHVNWETGEPDDPFAKKGIKTHCSSFVASVCKQKNIYILRPPAHRTELLASAQYDWLFSDEAVKAGWRQIKGDAYQQAQDLANQGFIVTAVYRNPNPHKPGHIALVMPDEKSPTDLADEGPTMIQAGGTNKNFISLKNGFKHHITYWPSALQDIAFFYNQNI